MEANLSNQNLWHERLELVMRATNDGLWDWDLETGEVYYSPRWKAMLGYAEADIEPNIEAWRRLVHPDDRAAAEQAVREHLEGRTEFFELEHRLRAKDGSYLWFLARGSRIPAALGQPERMIGSHTDITLRKQAEAALKTSENNLRTLLENARNFVVFQAQVDPDHSEGGRIVLVSPSIGEIAGIEQPEEFARWFENVHPEDRLRIEAANRRAWLNGAPYDQIGRVYHPKKQRWVWLHTVSTPIFDAEGRLTHFNGLILDISEQKEAEETLQRQIAFENIITTISTNFINIAHGDVDGEIARALRLLGEFAGVDRSFVFLYSGDQLTMTNTHEWCAPGIERRRSRQVELPVAALPWSNAVLAGGSVLLVPSISALPAEAAAEKAAYERQGIRSVVAVPMMYRGLVMGFLGLYSVRQEMSWPEKFTSLLKITGEIFVNALEHKRAQAIQDGQRQFLELLALGGGFRETLHALVRIIEEQWPGMQALILLLDEDGVHLHIGAAQSLPEEYVRSIEGLEIGPAVGSCGTACYTGRRVIVEDIATDPRWDSLRDLGLSYGLRACWSEPVLDASDRVMGTFAMYYRQPRLPGEAELRTIETAAHLVGIAIQHQRARREVQAAYQALEQHVEERTRQLSTLLEFSQNLATTLELEPMLDLILDQLSQVVHYNGASILKLDGGVLRVVAYRGPIPQAEAVHLAFPLEKAGANRQVIQLRRPLIIADVRGPGELAQAFREMAGEALETTFGYIRSWLGVPMIVKDQVIGMLSLDYPEPGYYQANHSQLALAFANQVAVAIENARLYSETRQRVDETATLLAVQQAITSRLDPDLVLQLVADEARRLTGARQGAVYMLDGDELVVSVISGEVSPAMLGYRLPVDGSVAGLAVQTGQPLLVSEARKDPRVYADIIQQVGAESFVVVPLITPSGPVGTITVADKDGGELSAQDERVLVMLASSAAIGLENARLYHAEQERRQETERRRLVAEGLRDILAILNSNHPLCEVLEAIVGRACQLLGANSTLIRHFDRSQNLLTIEAAHNLPPGLEATASAPFSVSEVDRWLMARRPVAAPDLAGLYGPILESPGDLDLTQQAGLRAALLSYRSALAVPLIVQEGVYGSLTCYFVEQRSISEEDLRLAVTLADHAALAIENARLRAQMEQSAVAAERSRLARDLHDAVTQTLFSASLIAEVLPKLWEKKPDEARRRLEELRQLTRGALAEMRTLLLELRPSALMEAELNELFRHLVEAFTGRARVPVDYHFEDLGRPAEKPGCEAGPDVKVALYRIAQEALNNIAKHAGATRVTVTLTCTPDEIRLLVGDDGKGFNPRIGRPNHLGLGIMKERAKSIRADLTLSSTLGRGTRLEVVWRPGTEKSKDD